MWRRSIPHNTTVLGEASSTSRGMTRRRSMLHNRRITLHRRRSLPGCMRKTCKSIWWWRSSSQREEENEHRVVEYSFRLSVRNNFMHGCTSRRKVRISDAQQVFRRFPPTILWGCGIRKAHGFQRIRDIKL
jgi:hypothetical protein